MSYIASSALGRNPWWFWSQITFFYSGRLNFLLVLLYNIAIASSWGHWLYSVWGFNCVKFINWHRCHFTEKRLLAISIRSYKSTWWLMIFIRISLFDLIEFICNGSLESHLCKSVFYMLLKRLIEVILHALLCFSRWWGLAKLTYHLVKFNLRCKWIHNSKLVISIWTLSR